MREINLGSWLSQSSGYSEKHYNNISHKMIYCAVCQKSLSNVPLGRLKDIRFFIIGYEF